MKRILTLMLACAVGVLAMSGCKEKNDYIPEFYVGYYSYINKCTYPIVFDVKSIFNHGGRVRNERFNLSCNDTLILSSKTPDFPPVYYDLSTDDFYTIISNSTTYVFHKPYEGIYCNDNYRLVSEKELNEERYKKIIKEYEYVITDDFFNDGLPIEEE